MLSHTLHTGAPEPPLQCAEALYHPGYLLTKVEGAFEGVRALYKMLSHTLHTGASKPPHRCTEEFCFSFIS